MTNVNVSEASIRARAIHAKRFNSGGTPCSVQYQEGCLYGIQRRLEEIEKMECPYDFGTSCADAWFAGVCDGRKRAAAYLDSESRLP